MATTSTISDTDWELQETTILELEIKNVLSTNGKNSFEKDLLSEILLLCERYRAHLKGRLLD
jgi:hypothetical protein